MKELDLIKVIESVIGKEYLGDDCAYLKDFELTITQDSLLEGIHFKREWYTPFELGYKSAAVNISDILASGAEPKYLTIALSLTDDIDEHWVEEFYKGICSANPNVKIAGGDITGSKNGILISVTALGNARGRKISSRKNAKEGYLVITKGNHGSSAVGLEMLSSGNFDKNSELVKAHIKHQLEYEFSSQISKSATSNYAMMDSSDGLADAVFKIAEASGVKITLDYEKIPHLKEVSKEQVLFGGEDFKLIAAVPESLAAKIKDAVIIGQVQEFDGIRLEVAGKKYSSYDELKVYNHFGEDNG